jgi:3-methyladenine DNA glycosylase AlkD
MGSKQRIHADPVASVERRLRQIGDPVIATHAQTYFKTGPGQYGEGDRFVGIRAAALRAEVRAFRGLALHDTVQLLSSPIHEARMLGVLLMVERYRRGPASARGAVYRAYLDHADRVNNWDLVDASAGHIVGAHLVDRSRRVLDRLARSRNLWRRRIAIVATSHFIGRDDFTDTLRLSALLLDDREDLIHKAVGWMLREIWKRDARTAETFLTRYYAAIPRTTLRYAIERMPDTRRRAFLEGTM